MAFDYSDHNQHSFKLPAKSKACLASPPLQLAVSSDEFYSAGLPLQRRFQHSFQTCKLIFHVVYDFGPEA
jgi:hypothetical protein